MAYLVSWGQFWRLHLVVTELSGRLRLVITFFHLLLVERDWVLFFFRLGFVYGGVLARVIHLDGLLVQELPAY